MCSSCPGPALVCFSRGMERAVFVLMVKGVFIFIRKNKLRSRRARQQMKKRVAPGLSLLCTIRTELVLPSEAFHTQGEAAGVLA